MIEQTAWSVFTRVALKTAVIVPALLTGPGASPSRPKTSSARLMKGAN